MFLRALAEIIELPAVLTRSDEVPRKAATTNKRLIEISLAKGATVYVAGPAARSYIDPEQFDEAGIQLRRRRETVAGWHKLQSSRRLGEGKRDLHEYRRPLPRIQRHLEVLVELIGEACRRFAGFWRRDHDVEKSARREAGLSTASTG